MKKPKFDERAVKIAIDRLIRETMARGKLGWYLTGYHEAICDFIWDYTGIPLKCPEWDAYVLEQVEKKSKNSPIKINSGC